MEGDKGVDVGTVQGLLLLLKGFNYSCNEKKVSLNLQAGLQEDILGCVSIVHQLSYKKAKWWYVHLQPLSVP